MTALATSTRHTLATLVAWLCLLCAQLTALPAQDVPASQPSVVTAPAQVAIARPQGSLLVVKADKSSSQGKQSPGLDLLVIDAASRLAQSPFTLVGTPHAASELPGSARRTHQARAPPAAGFSHNNHLTITS